MGGPGRAQEGVPVGGPGFNLCKLFNFRPQVNNLNILNIGLGLRI